MNDHEIASHALAALILVDVARVQFDEALRSSEQLPCAVSFYEACAAFDDAREDLLRYSAAPSDRHDEVTEGRLVEKLERVASALRML